METDSLTLLMLLTATASPGETCMVRAAALTGWLEVIVELLLDEFWRLRFFRLLITSLNPESLSFESVLFSLRS